MKIETEPKETNGYYVKGIIIVKTNKDKTISNGEILISKTNISSWGKEISDINKIIKDIGELIVNIYFEKGLLKKGESFLISSYDTEGRSYFDYIQSLKEELEILKKGKILSTKEINKIYNWTKNDIAQLKTSFPGIGIDFPSSGYSIFLFCLMDIWGSIFEKRFGKKWSCALNVGVFLEKLQTEKGDDRYNFKNHEKKELVDLLRNNLIHNYGLRVLKTNTERDWLNIDTKEEPIINKQENGRWHVNCIKLSEDILEIIENWIKHEHSDIRL